MKKLFFILSITAIFLFNSCNQIEEETIQNNNLEWINYNGISIAVLDNTLVFDNENDMYACYDLLCKLGTKDLDDFEKRLNFTSYRTFYSSNSKILDEFNDEHAITLLNPEQNIIVADKIIHDSPIEGIICANEIEFMNCSYIILTKQNQVTRDDDIFRSIKGEPMLKSSAIPHGLDSGKIKFDEFEYPITCRLEYNAGLFKNLEISMYRTWVGGISSMSFRVNPYYDSFYKEKNACWDITNWSKEKGTMSLTCSDKKSVRKLYALDFHVEFNVYDTRVPPATTTSRWLNIGYNQDDICD
jgi:hypothetical protein